MMSYFCAMLRETIAREIKGEVKVHYNSDMLIVDIYGVNGLVWRYARKNVQNEILTDLTTKLLSQMILKSYCKYVLSMYFN